MSGCRTWRQEAAEIIADAVKSLPHDASLAERITAISDARPAGWKYASWPQKAWQAARRDYLVRYGYQPRTKKAKEASMPLFDKARP